MPSALQLLITFWLVVTQPDHQDITFLLAMHIQFWEPINLKTLQVKLFKDSIESETHGEWITITDHGQIAAHFGLLLTKTRFLTLVMPTMVLSSFQIVTLYHLSILIKLDSFTQPGVILTIKRLAMTVLKVHILSQLLKPKNFM